MLTKHERERQRRRREEIAALARHERSREITRDALAAVYSGATFVDADAFLDQLGDRGGRVVL